MFVILLCLFFIWNCTNQSPMGSDSETLSESLGSLNLKINHTPLKSKNTQVLDSLTADSIEVYISSPETQVHITKSSLQNENIVIQKIIPGGEKIIEAKLFNNNGDLTYNCFQSGVEIFPGETTQLNLTCKPLFSSFTAVFTLGTDNPMGISSGSLTLENPSKTYSVPLEIKGDLGVFIIPHIQGDKTYALHASLLDADDLEIFRNRSEDSLFIPMGESVSSDIQLDPLQAAFALSLALEQEPEVSLNFITTASKLRSPSQGDIIFSEFLPEPDELDGGAEGEWIEILNRTQDSLLLNQCRIAKSRTSSSISTRFDIPDSLVIQPGKTLVFGRSQSVYKDIEYEFKMVGTKQSMLLICEPTSNETLIDSVAYTTEYAATDSIYSKDGYVSTKNHNNFSAGSQDQNWCQTKTIIDPEVPLASPGKVLTNCLTP